MLITDIAFMCTLF